MKDELAARCNLGPADYGGDRTSQGEHSLSRNGPAGPFSFRGPDETPIHSDWRSVFSADVLLRAKLTTPFDPIWSGLIIATVIQLSGMLATAFIGRLADHWRRSTILMVNGGVGAASSALIE